MVWGLTVGRGGQRGKNWDNCNRINNNEKLQKYFNYLQVKITLGDRYYYCHCLFFPYKETEA